jgi:mevalonate kinase
MGMGLGSSASLIVTLTKILLKLQSDIIGKFNSIDNYIDLMISAESRFHGVSSGIDIKAIL